jgi:hypothetical protein
LARNSASTLTVAWVSGNGLVVPTAIGIDKFFFNGAAMKPASAGTPAVAAHCSVGNPSRTMSNCLNNNTKGTWIPAVPAVGPTPAGVSSPGWSLNTNQSLYNADGFTAQYKNSLDNPGGTQTSGIVFTFADATQFAADFNASSSFAAHVRYDNSCSGFVSDQTHPGPSSDVNCDAPRIPEASSLLLLGPGLLLAGMVRRKLASRRQ